MKKGLSIIYPLILLTSLTSLMQGCTLRYDVLTECERRHPNGLITRFFCYSLVKEEIREEESRACVDKQRSTLISTYRKPLHEFLTLNGNEKSGAIFTRLQQLGYQPTRLTASIEKKETIVFKKTNYMRYRSRIAIQYFI